MSNVYILGAVRTAIGKYGGSIMNVSAADLGAHVIKNAMERAGVKPDQVSEVIMGHVLQAGAGQGTARQAAIKAGMPDSVPAMNINNICGSGMKAVDIGLALIQSGKADIVVVGGMENMSQSGYVSGEMRWGSRMGNASFVDTMVNDALTDSFSGVHMGITAENVAEKYDITREEQDLFAAQSQQKTEKALAENRFSNEIAPIEVSLGRGKTVIFDKDEYPRPGVTVESLSKLRPAFKKDGGTVTAGNASGINDGAAAMILASEEKVNELGLKPMARIVTIASAGVDPQLMGIGPAASTQVALTNSGLTIDDMDLIEANEAFASQSLAVGKLLNWDASKVNVNGGAISLGHPVGASGARILVTLLHEMQKQNSHYGMATLCVGGGMGVTTIVERQM